MHWNFCLPKWGKRIADNPAYQSPDYVKVPATILCSTITRKALALYVELLYWVREDGTAKVPRAMVAEMCGVENFKSSWPYINELRTLSRLTLRGKDNDSVTFEVNSL